MDTGLDPTTPVAGEKDPVRSLGRLGVDLFQVLACVADQVIVLDRDRRLVALIGDGPDEPFRRETAAGTLRDLFGPQVADAHEAGCAAALEGRYSAYEWIRRRGRQSLQLFTTASPLRDASANIVGIVLLTRMVGALSLDPDSPLQHISSRERQVLELLGQGYRPRSIAERLRVSPDTVRNHLKAMFKKTGTHSQEELTALLRAARNIH